MSFTFRTPHGTVHEVDADDPCRTALSSVGELVCPVHTGVQRPRSRRSCTAAVRAHRLCQVCLRATVPLRNFKDAQRHVCDDCLRLDREVAAARGGSPLVTTIQGESLTRRTTAHATLAFGDLWVGAVAGGLPVFVLDDHAPYWGAVPSRGGVVTVARTAAVRFAWFDDWRRRPWDGAEQRRRHLAWARAVHPTSSLAQHPGEIR
ncbi:hypothetical protein [Isoptericola dokdonensis]|jgi:hypothetical protein|uniref:Uncharacterized protein n=1 Tax=Isoptericola dokdonensis DS-3 TaxID=1300344 RepID=A0A161I2X6_9MICO|nr:hypothetical protein [Isoptericola dokdonensis]ANC32155.1 hypothetical protein I598_2625 [Isoptericola dokdonensis DS-3]